MRETLEKTFIKYSPLAPTVAYFGLFVTGLAVDIAAVDFADQVAAGFAVFELVVDSVATEWLAAGFVAVALVGFVVNLLKKGFVFLLKMVYICCC